MIRTGVCLMFFLFNIHAQAFSQGPIIVKTPVLKNIPPHLLDKKPKPVLPVWSALAFKTLIMEKQEKNWNWSAIVKNNGPLLSAGQARITANQLAGFKPVGPAGVPFTYIEAVNSGQIMNFGKQNWKRHPLATHLKVDIQDLISGKVISRTLKMPEAME